MGVRRIPIDTIYKTVTVEYKDKKGKVLFTKEYRVPDFRAMRNAVRKKV